MAPSPDAYVFPPALVSALRARAGGRRPWLDGVDEAALERLLTVVFFAGLEAHEGERRPVRVVFVGRGTPRLLTPAPAALDAPTAYRWKALRFEQPRPLTVTELVRLAVATTNERTYVTAQLGDAGLVVTGISRAGLDLDGDPFLKVVAPRPGELSVQSGPEHLVDYERGFLLDRADGIVLSAGPVRAALERCAAGSDLDGTAVQAYLDAVRSLVREMAAHGRGGILVIGAEPRPDVPALAPYRVAVDAPIADLLKISGFLARSPRPAADPAHRGLLRAAFVAEIERAIQQIGALSAIDGATILSCRLSLVGFGVILPVGEPAGGPDLAVRGTRHRAGASWADEHPGSIVFVASEDGHISCMLRESRHAALAVWRLGPGEVEAA